MLVSFVGDPTGTSLEPMGRGVDGVGGVSGVGYG